MLATVSWMSGVRGKVAALKRNPRYSSMRGVARFGFVRTTVRRARQLVQRRRIAVFTESHRQTIESSIFAGADPTAIAGDLRRDGVAFGLRLPAHVVDEVLGYAKGAPCYADREPALGFHLGSHDKAEAALGKTILVAQYFNTERDCPAVAKLAKDPVLQLIAEQYLGSLPKLVGVDLWWTFPVDATAEDRHRHAHLFHRDVDDFAFVKFFFYLTDVARADGPHVCVRGSHRVPPLVTWRDRFRLRRYTDDEIAALYPAADVVTIEGEAGTGFAEDTLCVHKGTTPEGNPRLLLQFEYALFDYGVMSDSRPLEALGALV
jgi:Phytanoyl-CoA dioxygenase (PhyH)